jgi:hypothetical protein
MRGILAAAALLAALAATETRASAYLDEAAWHNAVLDLDATLRPQGRTLRYVPIELRFVSAEDGYGTYTDFHEPALYSLGQGMPPSGWGSRSFGAGAGAATWSGGFSAGLGCASFASPCLGAWAMTFAFDEPVYGFGGLLDYRLGWNSTWPGAGIAPFDAVNDAVRDGRLYNPEYFSGFYGLLDPDPMTELRLTFWEGQNMDDTAGMRISGLMLVAVPVSEPAALPLLAASLALLLAGAARQGVPARGRARRPLTRA